MGDLTLSCFSKTAIGVSEAFQFPTQIPQIPKHYQIHFKGRMSSSALHNAQDDMDNIVRPRAVKPENPMVLRAMSEEGAAKVNGISKTPPPDLSRFVLDLPASGERLTLEAAVVRHLFLPTLLLLFNLYPQLESMCGHRSNIVCSQASNIRHVCRISIPRAIIPTSGVSSCYSGSV